MSADPYRRKFATVKLYVWRYKDAWLRGDETKAAAAWRAYCEFLARQQERGEPWSVDFEIIAVAAQFDDIDRAARLLLEWYPSIDTSRVASDSQQRAEARNFVSLCIALLERESSIDHPLEASLDAAMREVFDRHEDIPMLHHRAGFQRIGEIRARRRARVAIADARRLRAAPYDGLPPTWSTRRRRSWALASLGDDLRSLRGPFGTVKPWRAMILAVSALEAAERHDDTDLLERLIQVLEEGRAYPALTLLLLARLSVIRGDLASAMRYLESALSTRDPLLRSLRPQIYAVRGMLTARLDAADIDRAIELCRVGRSLGLRWWRRVTDADTCLARLLVWRAELAQTPPAQQLADLREAAKLARRRTRHASNVDDVIVLHDARAALAALTGQADVDKLHFAWRRAVNGRWSTAEQARLALAWAEWGAGADIPEFAAEAYYYLVTLTAEDAATRYQATARQRVLAAAQEYAEEAGYWLARTGNYREAVLALEIGRAVSLTEILGRDGDAVGERLRAAGQPDLADEYRRALDELYEQERARSPRLRSAWVNLRKVAERVGLATGLNPLTLDASYDDVIAQTGDGAVVYIAAAIANGYALIVASHHDPQFVELPALDRAAILRIAGTMLPGASSPAGVVQAAGHALPGALGTLTGRLHEPCDLQPVERVEEPVPNVLKSLWAGGVRDLVLLRARGRIVTLVPVGLLSLLPLHAAGDPEHPDDRYHEWRHAGNFSAIRYAPNARSLGKCRAHARVLAAHEQSLLAVDASAGPDGTSILHYVARETEEVTRRWIGPAKFLHECSWEQFRRVAHEYTVWHIACHAVADPESIMETRLCFADRPVTLEELHRTLRPGRRRLAILSACQTNVTGAAMPNEMVGLPSALLQVGFAGVVASAWRVDDLATTYLMTAFYERWCRLGQEPAIALNGAQQWLRSATRADRTALLPGVIPEGGDGKYPYADPRFWAAFAYTGA